MRTGPGQGTCPAAVPAPLPEGRSPSSSLQTQRPQRSGLHSCIPMECLLLISPFPNIQMLFSSTLNLIALFTPIPLSSNTDHLCLPVTPQARRGWVPRGELWSLLCSAEMTFKYTYTSTRERACQPNPLIFIHCPLEKKAKPFHNSDDEYFQNN